MRSSYHMRTSPFTPVLPQFRRVLERLSLFWSCLLLFYCVLRYVIFGDECWDLRQTSFAMGLPLPPSPVHHYRKISLVHLVAVDNPPNPTPTELHPCPYCNQLIILAWYGDHYVRYCYNCQDTR